MKRLLVTLALDLPDTATDDDADLLANYIAQLALARNVVEAYGDFPTKPVGKLSDWLLEGINHG